MMRSNQMSCELEKLKNHCMLQALYTVESPIKIELTVPDNSHFRATQNNNKIQWKLNTIICYI